MELFSHSIPQKEHKLTFQADSCNSGKINPGLADRSSLKYHFLFIYIVQLKRVFEFIFFSCRVLISNIGLGGAIMTCH